ncbi:MAG: hypothetical protein EBY70_01830 [Burkholderiaceae bacterium]|jgi:hypothetical protein|nr:hypothetical protein [Burkholderiaceae bacterium]
MREQMVLILQQLKDGKGVSLEDLRTLKYKEREFLFNEIQYWCLYEKDNPKAFAKGKISEE